MPVITTSNLHQFGRAKEVCRLLGISRSTLYLWVKDPAKDFPRPLKLGPGTTVWSLPDVISWVTSHAKG
jgi:predicted DNA-binding transcriptional regulator AlpA